MPVKSHRKLGCVIQLNVDHRGNVAPWQGTGEAFKMDLTCTVFGNLLK